MKHTTSIAWPVFVIGAMAALASAQNQASIGPAPGPHYPLKTYDASTDFRVLLHPDPNSSPPVAARSVDGWVELLGTLSPGQHAYAFFVSSDGTAIIGRSGVRAFRWTASGGMQDLGFPAGATQVSATAISSDGAIVMGGVVGPSNTQAFRWTQQTGMQILGAPPGSTNCGVIKISSDGQVALVNFQVGQFARPGLWAASSGFSELPCGSSGSVRACNQDGSVIVGNCGSSAVRWVNGAPPQSLGHLSGAEASVALAISDDGNVIVGRSVFNHCLPPRCYYTDAPFIWTPETGLVNLYDYLTSMGANTTGFAPFGRAYAISRDGRTILGTTTYQTYDDRAWIATLPGGSRPCYANCDHSTVPPVLNINDLVCFINRFVQSDRSANCDGSSITPLLTANDFQCFIDLFVQGCP